MYVNKNILKVKLEEIICLPVHLFVDSLCDLENNYSIMTSVVTDSTKFIASKNIIKSEIDFLNLSKYAYTINQINKEISTLFVITNPDIISIIYNKCLNSNQMVTIYFWVDNHPLNLEFIEYLVIDYETRMLDFYYQNKD